MAIRKERIFNADVGDMSVNNAGPDAIEQDLDNLYQNKAWIDDVLTKTNVLPYVPTQLYHPVTKEYADIKSANVFIENNNISILQTDVIAADTAQLVNAWIRNLFVEVLTTNFEDYITGTRIDNGYAIGNTKLERNYMKSEKEGLRFYQQILTLDPTDFIITNDGLETQIYYTSVRGAYAYKFFTIQNPVALAGDWQPKIKYRPYKVIKGEDGKHYYTTPTYSDNGYENWEDALPHLILTNADEHKVKVKTVVQQYDKTVFGFQDIETLSGTIKGVMLKLGMGDGTVDELGNPTGGSEASIYKHQTGLEQRYNRSNTGQVRKISLDDTGIHSFVEEYQPAAQLRNIIVTTSEPDASMGNVNDIIIQIEG